MNDIAETLTNSLDRTGRGGMLADLEMNGFRAKNLAPGTQPTDAATVSQLSGSQFPAGVVMDYAGATTPAGWLLCGGQSVARATYPDLFAAIGTAYGSVDGNSFNLPDFRGRVSAGRDFQVASVTANRLTTTISPSGTALGATGGAQTHTLTEAQMPAHTHTGTTSEAGSHSHQYLRGSSGGGGGGGDSGGNLVNSVTTAAGAHTHGMSLNNTGGGEAHNNVQPTILMNKIIKI